MKHYPDYDGLTFNRDAWPRLSATLSWPAHPRICQACGASNLTTAEFERHAHQARNFRREVRLLRHWQECSDHDEPEPIVITLCEDCGDRIIDPHPRLYELLELNRPFPGVLEICVDCQHRKGNACKHPEAEAGMRFTQEPRQVVFIDGADAHGNRYGARAEVWFAPPSDCAGRSVDPDAAPTPPPPLALPRVFSGNRKAVKKPKLKLTQTIIPTPWK